MIIPVQIRAARSLLGMTQSELAAASGISVTSLNNIESGRVSPRASSLEAIERALEAAGVIFIDGGSEGPGVRLRENPVHPW